MCLHKPNSSREIAFFDYVRVAITSARLNAPSLAPYVLYMHSPEEAFAADHEDDGITGWLRSMGVRVLNSRLSFLHRMPPRRWRMERSTGICKMDIPLAASAHRAELAARGLDTERVLMTDADVLFADDFTFARWPRARRLLTFAAGIEFFSTSLNSGVVYFNVSTLVAEQPRMLQYAIDKKFNFLVADQSWLQEWFDPDLGKGQRAKLTSWTRLDESIFNARPRAPMAWTSTATRQATLDPATYLALAWLQALRCAVLDGFNSAGSMANALLAGHAKLHEGSQSSRSWS